MSASITLLTPGVSASTADRVMAVIARETHKDLTQLHAESTLDELDVDSVDVVMILNGIEEEFGVYLPVEQGFNDVRCLRDFVTLVAGLVDKPVGAAQHGV